MHKKGVLLSCFGFIFTISLALFSSCNKEPDPPHTHRWSLNWSQSENEHWKKCLGCDEVKDRGFHIDADSNGECDVCKYPMPLEHEHDWSPNWSSDEEQHWKTCSGCDEITGVGVHFDEDFDGFCDTCNHEMPAPVPPESVTITFVNSGSIISSEEYDVGSPIVAPADPTQYIPEGKSEWTPLLEGDTFDGWFDSLGNKFVAGSTATSETIYTAKFTIVPHEKTIQEKYGMIPVSALGLPSVTLKNIGLQYDEFVSLPTDGNHLFGSYDYLVNQGIDLIFDYSYEASAKDTWFYFYLFNNFDESGVVIRVNTNKIDGSQKGYIYTTTDYSGDIVKGAATDGACFTCETPFDGSDGFIRIKATLSDIATNEFNIKIYFGTFDEDGDSESNQAVMQNGPKAGEKLDLNIVLGSNYFSGDSHKKIRFSNNSSVNAKIKNHLITKESYLIYKDEFGSAYGALPFVKNIVLPPLKKEGAEFLGWYDKNNNLVSPGTDGSGLGYIQAKFADYVDITSDKELNISPGESKEIILENSIGQDNYLSFDYTSNQPLKGTLNLKINSSSKTEEFFLEKDENNFNTFLDVYRKGGSSIGDITINSITFQNVGKDICEFNLNKFKHAPRNLNTNEVLYIKDDEVKAGISLRLGGALTSLQSLNNDLIEYIDKNEEIKIRSQSKISSQSEIYKVIKENPNLINIFDNGREIQQSYYFNVDSNNGYTRAEYLGEECQYNPVQSGDQHLNESKIIDFRMEDYSIWVKVQAADWAQKNCLSKSYMTNKYEIKDGLVYSNNTFINWYGFTNYDVPKSGDHNVSGNLPYALQELPAIYPVHPLNYFSSNFDGYEIYDNKGGWNVGTYRVESSNPQNAQLRLNDDNETYRGNFDDYSYHYEFRKHAENWCGYLNEDKFGLAVYMDAGNYYHSAGSNRHVYVSGNYKSTSNLSEKSNRTYYSNGTAKPQLKVVFKNNPVESCYIENTNYITTILGMLPSEYTKLNWSYALGADYLDTLKTKFSLLKQTGVLSNDFTTWAGVNI